MRAGTLKYPVQIWKVMVTQNDYNEQKDVYRLYYNTRANVTYNSGSRTDINNEIVYPKNLTFEVRNYVPVTNFDRLKYNGDYYRILAIEEEDSTLQHSMMKKIVCEKVEE